jgi:hypothetical protein
MAPLIFVGSIPAALALAASSRALGALGTTLSELTLVIGMLSLGIVLPQGPDAEGLTGWVILFLSSGLTALALTGVYHTLREQQRRTGMRLHVDRFWAVTTLSIVTMVILAGLLVGQIIAPGALVKVIGLLRPLWAIVVQILLLIIFVLAYLFFGLVEPLLAGIANRPARDLSTFRSPLTSLEELEQNGAEPIQIPPALGIILQVVLVLGLIAVVAYIFYLAAKRRREGPIQAEDQVVESRENILSADLLRSQLLGLLDGLRRKRPPPVFVDPGPSGDPRRIIREAYQRVLARAIDLDAPRAKSQTPVVYAHTLQQLWPQERQALETLTHVYAATRYSSAPPTQNQVRAVQEALSRIDAATARADRAAADETNIKQTI